MMFKRFDRQLATINGRFFKGRLFLWLKSDSFRNYKRIVSMSRRPIIIGGCARSGTTLMLSILSAHPRVFAIQEETHAFCPEAYSNNPNLNAEIRVERIYKLLLNSTIPESCHRWCEKTPKNVHSIDRILGFFGKEARFVHMVRDGRDVVTSTHPRAPSRYWVSSDRWVFDVSAGLIFESHPQVLTVKYEDLVSNSAHVLRRICEFIGEKFDPALMEYPASAEIRSDRAWHERATPIHERSVRRWQDDEHREVVKCLLQVPKAQYLLRHYDYIE
ncbi:MAG: sulfotransferase [Thermodesulfobacteriota bacterium]|nr:sulfotransferase [Thermodesulfobacteriota bacterium]